MAEKTYILRIHLAPTLVDESLSFQNAEFGNEDGDLRIGFLLSLR